MPNIDEFNWYTGHILGSLYQSFPIPLMLNHASLAEARLGSDKAWEPDHTATVSTGNLDAKMLTQEFHQQETIAWHTIRWLDDCGYVKTNDKVDHNTRNVCQYVLSPKGFEVLSIIPESLETKKSYGVRLTEAAQETAGEASRTVMAEIVGSALGAALRVFGLGGI